MKEEKEFQNYYCQGVKFLLVGDSLGLILFGSMKILTQKFSKKLVVVYCSIKCFLRFSVNLLFYKSLVSQRRISTIATFVW